MRTDLENITELSEYFDTHLFIPYYTILGSVQNPVWLRLGAPFIGIGDGCIAITQAASGIAEATFKGLVNIFLAIANRNSRILRKGILQIGLGSGAIVFFSIPIIIIRIFRVARKMICSPASAVTELQPKISINAEARHIQIAREHHA